MTETRERVRLVYITSVSYSGSTLLDLLISSHNRVTSVGELKSLSTGRDQCTCSATTSEECPFWKRVDERVQARLGLSLKQLRLDSDDDELFVTHNRAILEAVGDLTGAFLIVDSSKSVPRLRRLLETRPVDVLPIHLLRRPQAVVWSNLRKNHGWLLPAYRYGRRLRQAARALRDEPHLQIRYEDLAAAPSETLERVMRWVGLEREPGQLEWAGRDRHNLGGNPMRFRTDDAIRLDRAWETALAPWQKVAVGALAGIGRVSPWGTPRKRG